MPQSTEKKAKRWRFFNGLRAAFWIPFAAVAYTFGWINHVQFVSYISLYANWASDMASWRADVNPNQAQLNRIERKLDELLKERSEK